MTRLPTLVLAALFSLAATAASQIAIVKPSAKTAGSAGESAFAARLADHLNRFLSANGIAADIVDDASPATAIGGRRLVFLVMCQNPSQEELGMLAALKARGGKMFSFYSHSPALAKLMGVSLVGYRKSDVGAYSRIVFNQSAGLPPGTPAAIVQTSSNIFAAQPIAKRSRVVASWTYRPFPSRVQTTYTFIGSPVIPIYRIFRRPQRIRPPFGRGTPAQCQGRRSTGYKSVEPCTSRRIRGRAFGRRPVPFPRPVWGCGRRRGRAAPRSLLRI